ncbi:hypothetical protein ACLKA7_003917 [Drosophila subpalustris]
MSTKPQRKPLTGMWMLVLALLVFALTLTAVTILESRRAQTQEGEVGVGNVWFVNRLWTTHFKAAINETGDEIPATVERIARETINASHSNNYYEEQRAVVVNSESAPPESRIDSYEADPIYDTGDEYEIPQSEEERESAEQTAGEGRAATQGRPFDSYYGQWQRDSKSSAPATAPASAAASAPAYNNRNRPPYPVYDDIYDYPMGFQPRPQEQAISKQSVPVQTTAVATAPVPTESTLVTILKSLKQIWDLYQALTSAWNTVAVRHQESSEQLKKERLEKQRLRQQQQQQQKLRVNSKKPQRIEGEKLSKKAKGTTTTTSTTTTTTTESDESEAATAAPVKGVKGDNAQESSVRGLRQRRDETESASTDVGEGRYIKGDPLKGYYDFVITEGSYKFWAAFQVGTAILIIYSTFAAIYYSKVNPLTSDYDYQDYLGAGRSLSGGDDDFVDDSDAPSTSTSATSRIMDWIPRTAHSLKFIMDAIDKIPLDHDQKSEKGWSTGSSDTATSAEATGEN